MDRFTRDDAIEAGIALGIVVAAFILARIVAALLRRIVQRFFHQTETELDDLLADALRTPLIFGIMVFGLYLAARTISELDDQRDIIDRIYVASTVALIFIALRSITLGFIGWLAGREGASEILATSQNPFSFRCERSIKTPSSLQRRTNRAPAAVSPGPVSGLRGKSNGTPCPKIVGRLHTGPSERSPAS